MVRDEVNEVNTYQQGIFLNVLMHTFCVVCFLSVDNTWVITYEFNGFKKNVQLN